MVSTGRRKEGVQCRDRKEGCPGLAGLWRKAGLGVGVYVGEGVADGD